MVQVLIALWFAGPWFREEIMRHATHGVALALAETLQVFACKPECFLVNMIKGFSQPGKDT